MDTKKIAIILGVCGLALVVGAVFLSGAPSNGGVAAEETMPEGETHQVVFTDAGFEPKDITIKKGDVIEFSSQREYPFWPASDEHPTHAIYRAFDPLQPVPADQTWSFQFTRVGSWDYHDHLNSTFKGTVTVTE